MSSERRHLPITMTVGEFEAESGLSHTSIYKLIREGEIESVKVLGRRLVVVDSYLNLIDRLRNGGLNGGQNARWKTKVLAENDDSV